MANPIELEIVPIEVKRGEVVGFEEKARITINTAEAHPEASVQLHAALEVNKFLSRQGEQYPVGEKPENEKTLLVFPSDPESRLIPGHFSGEERAALGQIVASLCSLDSSLS